MDSSISDLLEKIATLMRYGERLKKLGDNGIASEYSYWISEIQRSVLSIKDKKLRYELESFRKEIDYSENEHFQKKVLVTLSFLEKLRDHIIFYLNTIPEGDDHPKQDIRFIHENVFKMLMSERDEDEKLTFTFRKSNRANRLENGFWFYGNNDYLALSFWSGMDWKNKTPNINFIILSSGESYLEFSVSDSNTKKKFVEDYFIKSKGGLKGIYKEGIRYRKNYTEHGTDYLASLEKFINTDRLEIDEAIDRADYFFDQSEEEERGRISFISLEDFYNSYEKILKYRESFESLSARDNAEVFQQSLTGFQIRSYGPIANSGFIEFPANSQWIFLIGENGAGKTSLLRAIASGICHTKVDSNNTYIKLSCTTKDGEGFVLERHGNEGIMKRKPLVPGFCSYGAMRLKTNHSKKSTFSFVNALGKNGLTSSLFNADTILIDIQEQLSEWERDSRKLRMVEKRKNYIKELLIDLLPNVYDIQFSQTASQKKTLYVEKDENGDEFKAVEFEKLASGLKSLIAMIGDMMMRLFNQQPHVLDPSELTGVVLVDEIDIHLHPKLQKYLVEQLTITFPKVQFIVTSHSPIPLLGAPENSCFFKVFRDGGGGVKLTDLTKFKQLGIINMLPNALLSSDLFGMQKIFNESTPINQVRTEDSVEDMLANDHVRNELILIAKRLKVANEKG